MSDEFDAVTVPEIELGVYQHYSGKKYEVIGISLHSETLEPMVIYKPLYATKIPLWARPYKMFIEQVVIDGKTTLRFKKLLRE